MYSINWYSFAVLQEEVYEHTSKFLIPQVIAGYNGTVFAYGATGRLMELCLEIIVDLVFEIQ